MSYFEIYKKKLSKQGSSVSKSLLRNSENFVIKNFADDPSYRSATLINNSYEEEDIDIRIKNDDSDFNEKYFILLPRQEIKCGNYICYDDRDFIISEIERNSLSPVAKGQWCNQKLTWKGLGFNIPCFITNDAYGSKILTDNSYLSSTDTKAKILVQDNEFTRHIKRDWRFIFNNSEFDIYRVIDVTRSMNTGIITLIVKKDKVMNEDNLIDNIAFNEELASNKFVIKGNSQIKVKTSSSYFTDAPVDIWEVDDTSIATITVSNEHTCDVEAIMADEYFILYGKDSKNNILCSKAISTVR